MTAMEVGQEKSEFLFYSAFRVEWDRLVTMTHSGSVSGAASRWLKFHSGVSSGLASFIFKHAEGSKWTEFVG